MKNNIISAVDDIIYSNYRKKNILILSGGGIRGIAHIGALKYLEEYKLLTNISVIAGTSVGTIIGFLLIIGYSPLDIFKIICDINCMDLFSYDFFSFNYDENNINNNKIYKLLIKLSIHKNIDTNITFYELYVLTKKKFITTATCINNAEIYYFDYINTPNMSVLYSIVMSSCIPILYKPIKYKEKYFIDGAFIDNYPINLFNNCLNNCIGIFLTENYVSCDPIENIESYIFSIIKCMLSGHTKRSICGYEKCSIVIDTDNISSTSFDISYEQKLNLFNIGYNTTYKWFNESNQLLS